MGDNAGAMHHDFYVLPRGMEHLDDGRIVHEIEERGEVDFGRQGIDQTMHRIPGHLDQAQIRPIGRLAHEFGVDGNEPVVGQAPAKLGQRFGGSHEFHRVREARTPFQVNGREEIVVRARKQPRNR